VRERERETEREREREKERERERERERVEEGTAGTSVWTHRRSGFLRSLAIVAEGYGLILISASASAKHLTNEIQMEGK
jgi:hypothetical protein